MTETASGPETMTHLATTMLEAMSLWAETNQRLMRELIELGSGAAREGLRLYGELQRSGLDIAREGQATALRWQASWKDATADPAAWYRAAVTEGVAGAQQAFRVAEQNALAVTRSAERLQTASETAGKGIQETCSTAVARLKEIYAA
jgi:hypothetical protein